MADDEKPPRPRVEVSKGVNYIHSSNAGKNLPPPTNVKKPVPPPPPPKK